MHALDYLNGTSETVQTLGWPTVQCGEQLTQGLLSQVGQSHDPGEHAIT